MITKDTELELKDLLSLNLKVPLYGVYSVLHSKLLFTSESCEECEKFRTSVLVEMIVRIGKTEFVPPPKKKRIRKKKYKI